MAVAADTGKYERSRSYAAPAAVATLATHAAVTADPALDRSLIGIGNGRPEAQSSAASAASAALTALAALTKGLSADSRASSRRRIAIAGRTGRIAGPTRAAVATIETSKGITQSIGAVSYGL
jgi:hypothetical protein